MAEVKKCPRCGKTLPISSFYRSRTQSYCIPCSREYYHDRYIGKHKVPDGIFIGNGNRLMEHKWKSTNIYWTGDMLSIMRRYYTHTTNQEMADMLGVSQRTVVRKARELGMKKDPSWLKAIRMEGVIMAIASMKRNGNAGWFKPGIRPANAFKPGHEMSHEMRQQKSKHMKRMWSSPLFRKKMMDANARPERRARISQSLKAYYQKMREEVQP